MSGLANYVSHLRIADPDCLVGAIRGTELEPWHLGGQHEESALTRILLPGSCLDQAEIGTAMWFRGAMPNDCYTMVFVTACPEQGHSFNFNKSHHDQCLGFFAPGEVLDATTPAGYRHGTLTVPQTAFLEIVESCYPDFPQSLLKKGGSFFPSNDACRNLTTLLQATADAIQSAPDGFTNETARLALESELQERFFDLILGDRGDGSSETNSRMTRRYQRMSLVRDFIRANSHRRILLQELCNASGLSRRGLEYLFVDLVGQQASAFLLKLRLHGVRRDLLAAGPEVCLVKQCALNWGFWHLGRFAAEYHALFHEKPSATLARRF